MSDSGISLEAGSTGSNSSAPLVNIAALAKLGAVGGYGNQVGSAVGGAVGGFSGQGIGGCSSLTELLPSASENC